MHWQSIPPSPRPPPSLSFLPSSALPPSARKEVTNSPYGLCGRKERLRAQELCESRGGRPGLPVPKKATVSVDVKQHSTNQATDQPLPPTFSPDTTLPRTASRGHFLPNSKQRTSVTGLPQPASKEEGADRSQLQVRLYDILPSMCRKAILGVFLPHPHSGPTTLSLSLHFSLIQQFSKD